MHIATNIRIGLSASDRRRIRVAVPITNDGGESKSRHHARADAGMDRSSRSTRHEHATGWFDARVTAHGFGTYLPPLAADALNLLSERQFLCERSP